MRMRSRTTASPPLNSSSPRRNSAWLWSGRLASAGCSTIEIRKRESMTAHTNPNQPLRHVDDWDDFIASRYRPGKAEEEFRNYSAEADPGVAEFYRQNHAHQTVDFVRAKQAEYLGLQRGKRSIWEMAEYLNTLVDDSDPD